MQDHYTPKSNLIPETAGIYRIVNTVNGKFYIGSTVNLHKRLQRHRYDLRRNAHHNQKLQNSWNKHTEDAFSFEIIEFVLPPFLLEREQYWLDKLRPWSNKGLNIAQNAMSPSLGTKHSPETRERLSLARLGKKHALGKHPSPEKLEKLRTAKLGKKLSPEHCAKISVGKLGKPGPFRGKKHTPETLAKLSQASTGQRHDPEEHASQMKTLIVTSPQGEVYVVRGIKRFCREHNLDISCLLRVAKGRCSQHKGWCARFPD